MMWRNDIYLGLGSNIDPLTHVEAAVGALADSNLLRSVSPAYRSSAVGMPGAHDFVNLAVRIRWCGELATLKNRLEELETRLGRRPSSGGTWVSRTIDIDILLDGSQVGSYGSKPWRVPHPDIARFAHVAVPLADIAGHLVHPTQGALLQVLAEHTRKGVLAPMAELHKVPSGEEGALL